MDRDSLPYPTDRQGAAGLHSLPRCAYGKAATAKSLDEVLKKHRTDAKMTQEFVAETLCVFRQAVSKWENGTSDPSTSNLLALGRLYGVTPEELLSQLPIT